MCYSEKFHSKSQLKIEGLLGIKILKIKVIIYDIVHSLMWFFFFVTITILVLVERNKALILKAHLITFMLKLGVI